MDDSDDATTAEAGTAATTAERGGSGRAANRRVSDRYELGDAIGRGGMGEVIAARDRQIGREVAIKLMQAKAPSTRAIARFIREAQIQGRLDHPAIVPVHELGRDFDGRPFFAMKKLAGTTLADLLSTEPRPRLLRAFVDVCLAVEFAHTRGFIHRDLKPENIMLGDFGEVYVLDWGVAKVVGEPEGGPIGEISGELATADGVAIGTAGYMAPEQIRGAADLDARADVYALGCVLFELLAGQRLHPKGGAGIATTLAGLEGRPSRRVVGSEVPPELDELCARATAQDRADRIATARELGESVQHYLDGDRDLALRKTLAKEHLAVATTSFASGDRDDTRRTAMREAGRALALDPTLDDAAALLGRLMLEPPTVTPAEVRVAIAEDNARVVRRTVHMASFVLLGYFLFLPLLIWGNPRSWWEAIALFSIAAIAVGLARLMSRPDRPMRNLPIWIASFLIIALIARMLSPFLVTPGVAAVTAQGLLSGPTLDRRHSIAIGILATTAVLVPWIAELAGWIAPTMTFTGDGINLATPYLAGDPIPRSITLVLTVVVLVVASIVLAQTSKRAERKARDHLHLQAWQLRQLV